MELIKKKVLVSISYQGGVFFSYCPALRFTQRQELSARGLSENVKTDADPPSVKCSGLAIWRHEHFRSIHMPGDISFRCRFQKNLIVESILGIKDGYSSLLTDFCDIFYRIFTTTLITKVFVFTAIVNSKAFFYRFIMLGNTGRYHSDSVFLEVSFIYIYFSLNVYRQIRSCWRLTIYYHPWYPICAQLYESLTTLRVSSLICCLPCWTSFSLL